MNVDLVEQWFREAFTPDPLLTVSEWADAHRILSKKSSAEPGRWSTERTPYLREIMDVLSVTHSAKDIVFKKSSQIGGTETGNNWLGYIIDHAPGPIMYVLPRSEDAKRNSKLRIDPLIEENPRLLKKVGSAKSRDSSNTILQKGFEGGELVITGANSAAGLRSMPARYLFLDEIDAYPQNVDGEGDPISLARARSRTFSRRKCFMVSTPTYKGKSKISTEFERSDKRFFEVPCPHCNHYQKFEFKNLKWTEGLPSSVLYFCEDCGEGIEERFKAKMLLKGKWVATAESLTVGFAINSLYAPLGWFSWAEIAQEYEDAKRELEREKKHEKMMAFTNTILGEDYELPGDSPEWERLYHRREDYEFGVVPSGGVMLTCGVDVQKDRLEYEVLAWGQKLENWSVEYAVLTGDTSQPEVWEKLASVLERTYPHQDGHELAIRLTCIDSGYNTQTVYNFCRKYPITRVVPVKGDDNMATMISIPKAVDVRIEGKRIRRGVKLWSVGVSIIKSEVYSSLKLDKPIGDAPMPNNYPHFPMYSEEYFKQLTAERVVVKYNRKGFSVVEWVKDRERNEALDVRVYNRAAASIIGLDRFRQNDWDKLKINIPLVKVAKPVENETKGPLSQAPKVRRQKKRSEFW